MKVKPDESILFILVVQVAWTFEEFFGSSKKPFWTAKWHKAKSSPICHPKKKNMQTIYSSTKDRLKSLSYGF
jgi:hypothetical protein